MKTPIYYFTEQDPDYAIKGSRDPLGLQVIWQKEAKKLIPYLSTVSGNLHDFQILCLAYSLYGKPADSDFPKYFLRFEQVMAYVRFCFFEDSGFNGINRVRKKVDDSSRVSISNKTNDEILSNQRAYGIWGKYNRPFRDMRLLEQPDFNKIFFDKVNALPTLEIQKFLLKLHKKEGFKTDIAELAFLADLLALTKDERKLYQERILKVDQANPYQNQLDQFFQNFVAEDFNLYQFIEDFRASEFVQDENLQHILNDIEQTERLLSPLSRIFRYLQTKPLWSKREIESDKFITQWKYAGNYMFRANSEENKTKNHLVVSMQKNNWALIEDISKRNKEVSAWRKGTAWITVSNDMLEVHHNEGAGFWENYNPQTNYDNPYFLNTYLGLHRQLYA